MVGQEEGQHAWEWRAVFQSKSQRGELTGCLFCWTVRLMIKSMYLSGSLGVSMFFFPCLIQIAALGKLQSPITAPATQPSNSPSARFPASSSLKTCSRPGCILVCQSKDPGETLQHFIHPLTVCLFSRRSESGTLRMASLQSLSSTLWIVWFWA